MTTSISKPTQVLFATFITFFLLLLNEVNSLEELSFNFEKFSPNQMDLLFQGGASATSSGVLQLTQVKDGTPVSYSVGRARYVTPLRIWDSTTGKVASFTTSFSFVIKAPNPKVISDGLALFLAPPDSQIPSGYVSRYLGLFKNEKYVKSNQMVAVEFDTYFGKDLDPWDPNFRHIGINVNTIKSTKTVKWDWRNGQVANVTITYQAPTKALTVSLTYPSVGKRYSVTGSVDLKAVLPERVRVGFSAATGSTNALETHDVLSWYFSSTFKTNNYDVTENNVPVASYTA